MLKGLFQVLFLSIGKGLVRLGYGKKGTEARNLLGMKSTGLSLIFSILTFFWLFGGVFSYFAFKGSADEIISLAVMIACPVIYVLWFFYARSKVSALVQKAEPIKNQKAEEEKIKIEKERKESLLKRSGF